LSIMDDGPSTGGSILSRFFFGIEEPRPASPTEPPEDGPRTIFEVPSALLRYEAASQSRGRCSRRQRSCGMAGSDSLNQCQCNCTKPSASSRHASKSLSSYSSSPRSPVSLEDLEETEDDEALPCSRPGCPERSPEASAPPRRRQPLDCVGDGLRRSRREREYLARCQCAALNGHRRGVNGHSGPSLLSYALQELSMTGVSSNCLGSLARRTEYQGLFTADDR